MTHTILVGAGSTFGAGIRHAVQTFDATGPDVTTTDAVPYTYRPAGNVSTVCGLSPFRGYVDTVDALNVSCPECLSALQDRETILAALETVAAELESDDIRAAAGVDRLDMPAAAGRMVQERHAAYCRVNGHAAHTVDGVDSGRCARCGDAVDTVTASTAVIRGQLAALDALEPAARRAAVDAADAGTLPVLAIALRHRGLRCAECVGPLTGGACPVCDPADVSTGRIPEVGRITVEHGAAGAVAASGVVTYPGEAPRAFAFHGSTYGGPVAYTFDTAHGIVSGFVTEPGRFGYAFHAHPGRWVAEFYA